MPRRRIPRDLDADELIQALKRLDYSVIRQSGSHIRVRTLRDGEYHETIPCHSPLKVGTLGKILRNIGEHHKVSREELLEILKL